MRKQDAAALAQTLEQSRRANNAKAPLPKLPEAGPLPAKTGTGRGTPSTQKASTGAIAGPLHERNANDRRYHPAQIMLSSDGLFAFEVRCIERVVMHDANGQAVEFLYAKP